MKIGIFGGTFSPPHITHIEMATQAVAQLSLDKLIVVPNGIPPHKECDEDKFDRLNMTKLAFGNIPQVTIDSYEIDQNQPSYTYLTLQHYRRLYPDDSLYLIIGGDSLRDFSKWKNPEIVATLATLTVADRPNCDFDSSKRQAEQNFNAQVVKVEVENSPISSTDIRIDYQFGFDVRDKVPQAVDEYIKKRNLYVDYRPLVDKLKPMMTAKRFSHTYYVVKAGLTLPVSVDKDKIFVACLLHDCAKYVTRDRWSRYGFVNSEGYPDTVIHGPLGAKVARQDFGITDTEILDAIKYHTTGRIGMTTLDKVVYVADKIEQTRPFPTEHLIGDTFEQTFVNVLVEATSSSIAKHGRSSIFPLSLLVLDYYTGKE